MITTTIVGVVQLAILTRLLTRTDFGLMAMILTVIGFAQVYSDMGFSSAIIYRQDATRDQLSTLYWANLIGSFGIFVVVVAISPLAAAFFRQPDLQTPMLVASLIFLITPFGQQFQMLLQRELLFRRLAAIDISAHLLGLAVAVVAGLADQGVYALIYAQLAVASARASQLAFYGWRRWTPRLRLRWGDLGGFIGFGLYQMGERSIYYWAANIDYLLIGRFLGPEQLGLYTIAYQLVVMPVSRLAPVLTRVAFPVFAKRQHDDAALRRGFRELIELVSFATWPLLIGLAATAPIAVTVIFGAEWAPSVLLVQLMVPMGMLKCIGSPSGSLLLAKGRADLGFWLNVVNTAVTVVALYIAVQFGTAWVAGGHSLIQLALMPLELYIVWLVSRLHPGDYLRSLVRPLLTAGIMGVCVAVAHAALRGLLPDPVTLAALVVLGVAVYLLAWTLLRRDYLPGLWRLLVARREEPAAPA
jgi:O-antigen/teichoic acid export membrane protein